MEERPGPQNDIAARHATPRPTLIELPRMYADDGFRERMVAYVRDPVIFWRLEYASYDQRFRAEAAAPILSKVGQIAASPVLRNILGQTSPKFDLAYAMNNRQVLIANLAKGQIGEQASNLLGSLLVSDMQLVAMARSELPHEKRVPFFVHVDEFQNFSTVFLRRCCQRRTNSRRLFASPTNTSNRSPSMFVPPCSAMPGR